MTDKLIRIGLPASLVLFCVLALYKVTVAPGSQRTYVYLGGLVFLELIVLVLWNFERAFFPVLIIVFLAAGTGLAYGVSQPGRWVVLAIGAAAGTIVYLKHRASFGLVHLVATFCLVSACVSSMVSSFPSTSFLKTGSLFLVFLYGATGARMAVLGKETRFINGLVLGCEILAFGTAISYFVLRAQFFGNPNSLGAVMGVAIAPVLIWSLLVSEGTPAYPRRVLAAVACMVLLLSSYSRAGIGAGTVVFVFLCVICRRYRLLAKGFGIAILIAPIIAATVSLPDTSGHSETLLDTFLYKGRSDAGLLGSRQGPWQQTSDVIRRYPWFGSGFGTSTTSGEVQQGDYEFRSSSKSAREHGSSYLAIVEWMGLLGVVPFALLLGMIGTKIYRAAVWLRRTGNILSPLAPVTAVIFAGMLHALFEDWMFAPGYYLCVFFWSLAFIHSDLLLSATEQSQVASALPFPASIQGAYSVASAGR